MPSFRFPHYAWVILFTCFANLFINYAVQLGYGVILPEMIQELNFGRTAAGTIFNAYLTIYIALTPLTGYLADRLGARRIVTAAALILGIGTVLGGVWANESWGRFWGWDPKEAWALITFLGYLLIVHLRHYHRMNNFWLGLSSIVGFLLVIMTWYGVNFLLGRGLHSYASGSGNSFWVVVYLVVELLFVCTVFALRSETPVGLEPS